MDSCTDPLRLNENRLFKHLKDGLSKSAKETRNILEIRDDVLYVWNADECCVLALNIAATCGKPGEDVPYQTLQPTDPPIFEITNLLVNETVTQLALWGNLGVVLVELPRRWGKDYAFQGGKEIVSCVSRNLNECSSQLSSAEVRRVRWHPGSANDSHLLVLTSENGFQLYECELGNIPRLIKMWKVGPTPSSSPSKYIPNIESLGETAVDFDFSTPTLKLDDKHENKKYDWNEIDWPIFVLCGNGNVLLVRGNILSGNLSKPVVLGTLTMYPPADDNYGIDSCSIMCIQTTPPIVVIATCTGKIYHALFLKDNFTTEDDEHQTRSVHGSTYSLHTPEDALFIYECVELELGLLFSEQDKKYSCPIHLHNDKGNKSRYFCSHNAGIHSITLPMVSQLEEYVGAPEEETDRHLAAFNSSLSPSSSQYLACTRTKHTGTEEATPVLGFGLMQQPCPILIALLHTGVVIDLSVFDLDYLPRINPPPLIGNPSKKVTREPFDTYIRNLLKHDSTSQPITKLGPRSNITAKECLELLYRAITVFRDQHFARHDKVRTEIEKKVRALKTLKTHQLRELEILSDTRRELTVKAESLAESYEDIKDAQEELARRAKDVLKLVNYKEPSMSSSERAEAEKLKNMDDKVSELVVRLAQLKKKVKSQSQHLETLEKCQKQKELVFSKKQKEAIATNLGEMGKNINDLISQVKLLEEEVDV